MKLAQPTSSAQLQDVVSDVERLLASFYAFDPLSSAVSHLVSREQLKHSLGDQVTSLREYQARAGVFLFEPSRHQANGGVEAAGEPGELFIGIHFDDSIKSIVEAADPRQCLEEKNLDAFCVLVEEISHFHLILNRAEHGLGVSKLELEWQGEVDKLLICAKTLEAQVGDPHLEVLTRKLFDVATIESDANYDLYWQATRYAARFWFEAVRKFGRLSEELRETLKRTYEASWTQKLAHMEKSQWRRAS